MSADMTVPELLALASDVTEKLEDAGITVSNVCVRHWQEINILLVDDGLAAAAAVELGLPVRDVNEVGGFYRYRGQVRGVRVAVSGEDVVAVVEPEAVAS